LAADLWSLFVFFRLDTWYDIVYGHGYHYTHSNGEAGLGGIVILCLRDSLQSYIGIVLVFQVISAASKSAT